RKDRLEALAGELGNARALVIDLARPGAVARLMADLAKAGEEVDLLVNNAGFGLVGRFATLDAARQREMIDLNIGALTDLCRAVAPGMIERRGGAILNLASTAAFLAGPGMAVYFATKAYVLSFTEALHEELKPHGIRVSVLCPGPTRTEFGAVAGYGGHPVADRMGMDAAPVVALGLKALERNQAVMVTGAANKIIAWATRFIPRSWLRKIVGTLKY
ncbi:MAG: SDR family NAD(P)-dependent oxidoreductase, partial [Sphingomicrobium sp.]